MTALDYESMGDTKYPMGILKLPKLPKLCIHPFFTFISMFSHDIYITTIKMTSNYIFSVNIIKIVKFRTWSYETKWEEGVRFFEKV